ncbi:MAG: hypothetical protein QG671_3054, partial [Actinomycetota bacterium]|nr:hypothetical protein [Actinomycetota bacterium]
MVMPSHMTPTQVPRQTSAPRTHEAELIDMADS